MSGPTTRLVRAPALTVTASARTSTRPSFSGTIKSLNGVRATIGETSASRRLPMTSPSQSGPRSPRSYNRCRCRASSFGGPIFPPPRSRSIAARPCDGQRHRDGARPRARHGHSHRRPVGSTGGPSRLRDTIDLSVSDFAAGRDASRRHGRLRGRGGRRATPTTPHRRLPIRRDRGRCQDHRGSV